MTNRVFRNMIIPHEKKMWLKFKSFCTLTRNCLFVASQELSVGCNPQRNYLTDQMLGMMLRELVVAEAGSCPTFRRLQTLDLHGHQLQVCDNYTLQVRQPTYDNNTLHSKINRKICLRKASASNAM